MDTLCRPPETVARVRKPRVLSAAERTGVLFDAYHLLEQCDFNAPKFDGPRLRQVGINLIPHLAVIGSDRSLCGIHAAGRRDRGHGRVCQACRVEASRIRGVIAK
jgi:hypothetical protein